MAPRMRHADVSSLALLVLLCAGMVPAISAAGSCKACYKENDLEDKVCSDSGTVNVPNTSSTGDATCETGTCTTSCGTPVKTAIPQPLTSLVTTRVVCTCAPAPNPAPNPSPNPSPTPGGNGDPHFEGPEGIKYDFHGEQDKDFCLISDTRFHMNSHFIGQETEHTGFTGTWMDSFFFIYTAEDGQTEHTLHVAVADSPDASHVSNLTIAFDSEPILLHEPRFAGSGDATWRASDGSCALEHLMTSAATDGVRVNISGVVDMGIQVASHRFPDGLHLDFSINALRMTSSVHGVLGQMFKTGKPQQFKAAGHVGDNGEGIVDGTYRDYQTSDLASPDCKFSQYVRSFEAPGTDQPGSRYPATSRKLLSDAQTLSVSGGFACRHVAGGGLVCAGV